MPTYARRRLRLGIGAVGATVLLALVALVADLPHRLIPVEVDATFGGTLAAVLAALLVHAAVLVPFDVAGGLVVVRARPDPVRWSLRVLRAIVAQLAIVLVGIALVMRIAMQFGTSAAIAVTALLQLALLHRQGALARLASGVRTSRPPAMLVTLASEVGLAPSRVRVAEVADEPAFTGGWVGLQAPALWVPAAWLAQLDAAALRAQLARRAGVLALGLRRRGVLVALAWNTVGVLLAVQLPGTDLVTAAGMVGTIAACTLWSFVGVLVLPSLSRPAVLAADAWGASATSVADTARAVAALDALQDDEPVRAAWIERIFHPVPARAARLAALEGRTAPVDPVQVAGGAWHATRTMLQLSAGAFGLLGRAVHCNVGRPGLWVLYPGD